MCIRPWRHLAATRELPSSAQRDGARLPDRSSSEVEKQAQADTAIQCDFRSTGLGAESPLAILPFANFPNKSKPVQSLLSILRHAGSLFGTSLTSHPLAEGKPIFHMAPRNARVTFALLVDRQIAEAHLPIRFKRVPNKSKLVELLPPHLRQSLFVAAPIAVGASSINPETKKIAAYGDEALSIFTFKKPPLPGGRPAGARSRRMPPQARLGLGGSVSTTPP